MVPSMTSKDFKGHYSTEGKTAPGNQPPSLSVFVLAFECRRKDIKIILRI